MGIRWRVAGGGGIRRRRAGARGIGLCWRGGRRWEDRAFPCWAGEQCHQRDHNDDATADSETAQARPPPYRLGLIFDSAQFWTPSDDIKGVILHRFEQGFRLFKITIFDRHDRPLDIA